MLGKMNVPAGKFDRARFDFAVLGIANPAVGKQVEQFFALFSRRMIGEDVAAKAADEAKPVSQRKNERGFNLAAKAVGDGGAFARGGNCNLEIASPDDSGEIKITVRRIVDGIGEDPARLCCEENLAIHGGAAGGGDGEKSVAKIVGVKFALVPDDTSCGGKFGYFGFRLRCDDGDLRAGAEQGSDLRGGDCTGSDDQARATLDFDKGRTQLGGHV